MNQARKSDWRRRLNGAEKTGSRRMTWNEIRGQAEYHGRWVALRGCSYDASSGQATEGELVDRDDDLATLCGRIRDAKWTDCAVLFCPGQ